MNAAHETGGTSVFAREFRTRLSHPPSPIDAAAMLNVLMLGALFFLVHAPFILQPGLSLDLPETTFDDGQPYGSLVVAVTSEGLIFAGDRRVGFDELPAVFTAFVLDHPGQGLIVQADRRVPHGTLISLIDTARQCGFQRVLLASRLPSPPRGPTP